MAETKEPALKACPFCNEHLLPNNNPDDFYVSRYGVHYRHPQNSCHLSDDEVTPSEVEAWNRRSPQDEALFRDALRYRFIREARTNADVHFKVDMVVRIGTPEEFDAAIDTARLKEGTPK